VSCVLRRTAAHDGIEHTHECDDVDENLVTENVNVQFAGDVTYQLHEHVFVRHLEQFVLRLANGRRTLGRTAHELHASYSSRSIQPLRGMGNE